MAGKKKTVRKPRQISQSLVTPRYGSFELVACRQPRKQGHPLTSERGAAIILGDEKDLGSVNPPSGNPVAVPT